MGEGEAGKVGRLPTFLVIGAKRSGTTALARYLGEHPDVFVAGIKEVHYFDFNRDRGSDWYAAQFPAGPEVRHVGEATQTYLLDPRIPPLMAGTVPQARLIAILRNPVDRAYSDYWWQVSRGREDLGFEAALAAEPERVRAGDAEYWSKSYLERGMYADQLQRVLEFYPSDQLHVLLTDDMEADPHSAYAALLEFLEVDTGFVPDLLGRKVNRHIGFRSLAVRRLARRIPGGLGKAVAKANQRRGGYPPMDPETRRRLTAHFEEPNSRLEELLGRDLKAWRM